jgi:hypothetical protein
MVGNLRVNPKEASLPHQRVKKNSLGRARPRTPEEVIGHLPLNWDYDLFAGVEDKLILVPGTEANSLK